MNKKLRSILSILIDFEIGPHKKEKKHTEKTNNFIKERNTVKVVFLIYIHRYICRKKWHLQKVCVIMNCIWKGLLNIWIEN